MMHDPLADALSNIKNAQIAGKFECVIRPSSKLIGWVLKIMREYGYIRQFEYVDDGKAGVFHVQLSGRINDCGVIKPRFSVKIRDFEKFEARYLPAQDLGYKFFNVLKRTCGAAGPSGTFGQHKDNKLRKCTDRFLFCNFYNEAAKIHRPGASRK